MGITSYTLENLPPASQEELDRIAAIKDEDIDFSDIPHLSTLKPRPRYPADRGIYKPLTRISPKAPELTAIMPFSP
jgi:hypothetical protein